MARITTTRPLTDEEFDALSAARTNLLGTSGVNSRAYYGIALYKTAPVAAEGLGTWAVDEHWRMYIDPQCLPGGSKGWTAADCADVIEHELGHLLRGHALRMHAHAPNADPEVSNIATDMEINDDLDEDSFVRKIGVLPANADLPDGKTAEWYYDRLMRNSAASNTDGDDPSDEQAGGNTGAGQSKPSPSSQPCGSGAGNAIDGELPADSPVAPALGDGDAELARRSTAEAIKKHTAQYGRGSVPGGLEQWANVVLTPPVVPWQQTLRSAARHGFSRARGAFDYTYSRVSRRSYPGSNVILPGTFSPSISVDAIVDVSGSMSDKMVFEAISEIEGVARAAEIRGKNLRMIQVDAAVGSVQEVWNLSRIKITGRGGTDMRVGIALSNKMMPRASVQIILTDGDTAIPLTPPPGRSTQQIWVLIGRNAKKHVERFRKEMPWAEVIHAA